MIAFDEISKISDKMVWE